MFYLSAEAELGNFSISEGIKGINMPYVWKENTPDVPFSAKVQPQPFLCWFLFLKVNFFIWKWRA